MSTLHPTTVRRERETSRPRRVIQGLQSIGRAIARAWDALPAVRPFTGPESLASGPGERRLLIQGRVVVIRVRRRR